MSRVFLAIGLAFVTTAFCGCGGKDYQVVQVSGKLTLDGQPLSDVQINFIPVGKKEKIAPGPHSTARTDANGDFTLECRDGSSGAIVGKHRIAFTVREGENIPTEEDLEMAKQEMEEAKAEGDSSSVSAAKSNYDRLKKKADGKSPVPDKYLNNRDFTFEVPEGGTDSANIELTSD